MNFNDEDHRIHARINAILSSDDEKLAMIATLLGMSAAMTEYISNTVDIDEVPDLIKYSMAVVAGNMMAFMSGQKVANFFQIETKSEIDIGEQREEEIYRKMKSIIKMLHAQIEKEEQNGI